MSICVSEGWRKKGVWLSSIFVPLLHRFIECLQFAVGIWVPGANSEAGPGSSHASPSPHTPTVRNDLCFLLFHNPSTPHICIYFIFSPQCLCIYCSFYLECPSDGHGTRWGSGERTPELEADLLAHRYSSKWLLYLLVLTVRHVNGGRVSGGPQGDTGCMTPQSEPGFFAFLFPGIPQKARKDPFELPIEKPLVLLSLLL